jgi:phosphoglycolate phosphatase
MPAGKAPMVQSPKAVLFDWVNTLVDSWGTIHAALWETFTAMGVEPWSPEETRQRVRYSMRESFPPLFGDAWEEASRVFYEAFERLHIQHLAPQEGAGEMLAALQETGACLGVVSNKTGRYLRQEVETLDWDRYFHRLVGAGDAPRDKPAEDPVHLALSGSNVVAGESVWFVGDAGVDMEIAYRTGCLPVLLQHTDVNETEFADFQPAVRFHSCAELARFVETM